MSASDRADFALRPGPAERIVCLPLERAGVPHGFCTRRGRDDGALVELQFGRRAAEQARRQSVERAARSVRFSADRLYLVQQVHGREVVTVSDDDAPGALRSRRADALVSRSEGAALAVLTADCVPILLADPRAGVISAVHAGWRGAAAGVISAAVTRATALGAEPRRMLAAIGPCISAAAYEVGDEVAERFSDLPGVVTQSREQQRPHLDLRSAVAHQLRELGVGAVWVAPHCTYRDEELLHSFRRDGERAGRLLSVIALAARAAPDA